MATALDTFLLYDSGAGANVAEAGWRQSMRHLHGSASGVIRGFANEFAVTGDSTGMQVKAATGECWIRGNYGESTSIKTLAITAAHATLGRKDRVVLRNDFGNNRIELDILTGTAAGAADGSGATAPAVSQTTAVWETSLAIVTVPAGDTSIDAAQVIDNRTYTTTQAKYVATVDQSLTNGVFTRLAFDTAVSKSGDVSFDDATDIFTLLRAGLWTISLNCRVDANGTGKRELLIADPANVSGATVTNYLSGQVAPGNVGWQHQGSCVAIERLPLNQQIAGFMFQNSGSALLTEGTINANSISFVWVGP